MQSHITRRHTDLLKSTEEQQLLADNEALRKATDVAVAEARRAAEKKNRQLHAEMEQLQEQLSLTESQLVDLKNMHNDSALQVSNVI